MAKMSEYLILNADPDMIEEEATRVESARYNALYHSEMIGKIIEQSHDFWTGSAGDVFRDKYRELNRRLSYAVYETLSLQHSLFVAADSFRQQEAENMADFNDE